MRRRHATVAAKRETYPRRARPAGSAAGAAPRVPRVLRSAAASSFAGAAAAPRRPPLAFGGISAPQIYSAGGGYSANTAADAEPGAAKAATTVHIALVWGTDRVRAAGFGLAAQNSPNAGSPGFPPPPDSRPQIRGTDGEGLLCAGQRGPESRQKHRRRPRRPHPQAVSQCQPPSQGTRGAEARLPRPQRPAKIPEGCARSASA